MADWIVVPSLVRLRSDFNAVAPDRDKTSDGSVADKAHYAAGNSDHIPDEEAAALRGKDADKVNEVHAIDVDVDLHEPGLTMEMVVQHLVARCRAGLEDRLRYIIYNRRIWEADNGWKLRAYTGANPHDKHAHFSASYGTAAEADKHTWHLEDLVALSLSDNDIKRIWEYNVGAATGGASQSAQGALVTANLRAGAIANTQIPALASKLGDLLGKDFVDEAAIATIVLDGLTPQNVAAIPEETAKRTVALLSAQLGRPVA